MVVEEVSDAVRDACAEAGTPEGAERDELITEIQMLADTFAVLMKISALLLRLDVITSNACKRFHIDAVSARALRRSRHCPICLPRCQSGRSRAADAPYPAFWLL